MIYLALARFLSQRRRKEVCQVRKILVCKPQLHDGPRAHVCMQRDYNIDRVERVPGDQ